MKHTASIVGGETSDRTTANWAQFAMHWAIHRCWHSLRRPERRSSDASSKPSAYQTPRRGDGSEQAEHQVSPSGGHENEARNLLIGVLLKVMPPGRAMLFVPTVNTGKRLQAGLGRWGGTFPSSTPNSVPANDREMLLGQFTGSPRPVRESHHYSCGLPVANSAFTGPRQTTCCVGQDGSLVTVMRRRRDHCSVDRNHRRHRRVIASAL